MSSHVKFGLVGSTPAAAANDLRYQSSWAFDLYGAPKSLSSHIPVSTGAGSIPAVRRVGLLGGVRAQEARVGELRGEHHVEAHHVDRAVPGGQAPHHLLPLRGGGAGQRLDPHLVCATRGVRALFGTRRGPAVVRQDVPRQRRGTALTPAAGQQCCRDQIDALASAIARRIGEWAN